jgi:hypothetical protein
MELSRREFLKESALAAIALSGAKDGEEAEEMCISFPEPPTAAYHNLYEE